MMPSSSSALGFGRALFLICPCFVYLTCRFLFLFFFKGLGRSMRISILIFSV